MLDTLANHPAAAIAAPFTPACNVTLAMTGLEMGAIALLMLALLALAAALRNLAREPGGVRSLFSAEPNESSGSAREAAEELRLLIAEARQLSDQLADRFDGRAEELAGLLREADARIARLESAPHPAHAPTRSPGQEPSAIAEGSGPGRQARAVNVVEPSMIVHAGDPMAGEIYRLSDEGLPPVEIATRLGQHTGKVELILALRRG